jgi:hypothetical protein
MEEMSIYVEEIDKLADESCTEDVVKFWSNHKSVLLRKLALELLTIPATSASVERLFSIAVLPLLSRSRNTGAKLLEAQSMLRYCCANGFIKA